jgi:GNAT superfamily N-acetyltransferase
MRLRKAAPADLDIVLHHRAAMFRDMGQGNEPGFERAQALSRTFFEKAFASGTYHGWFFEDPSTGEVVAGAGVVLIEFHAGPTTAAPYRPWVVNVYTEREWRRRGLARRLMDVAIEWTRANGYPHLYLHASKEGRALYDSLGFLVTNEMRLSL